MSSLRIRSMAREDVPLILDWAAQEGWNPGLTDAEPFYAADPEGFLIGRVEGEPVGCVSAIAYGPTFGFLGLYIVKPEWRGRGHGMALWRHAMERLEPRNVGLDGVVAQQDNYRKSGFAFAHRNVRHGGERVRTEDPDPAAGRIVSLGSVPMETVERYDRALFPVPRRTFLDRWIAQKGTRALGLLRDGELAGYGCLRPCMAGFKVGPLFAEDEAAAEALFRGLVAGLDEAIFLDTPEPNPAAIKLAGRHGLKPVFETARMYTRTPPRIDLKRIYGLTSFELG
jgi:GNAT superfamily N-acetyltransferase